MAGINFFDTREPGAEKSSLPPGGDPGQVLTKKTENDFDADWKDPPEALPEGGSTGQILTKKSDDDFDADWQDPKEVPGTETGIPDGGTQGQVLTKLSDDDGDAVWKDAPTSPGGRGWATVEDQVLIICCGAKVEDGVLIF